MDQGFNVLRLVVLSLHRASSYARMVSCVALIVLISA